MNIGSLVQKMGAQFKGMTRQVPDSHNSQNPKVVRAVKETFGPSFASFLTGVNTTKMVVFALDLSLANKQVNQAISAETSAMRQKCLKVAAGSLLAIATLYVGWNHLGSLSSLNLLSYFQDKTGVPVSTNEAKEHFSYFH